MEPSLIKIYSYEKMSWPLGTVALVCFDILEVAWVLSVGSSSAMLLSVILSLICSVSVLVR